MKDEFPSIVDEKFTANMESLLDKVEEGEVDWKEVVRNFYPDLDEAVKAAEQKLDKIEIADEVTDEVCEMCGRHMVIKYGPPWTVPGLSRISGSREHQAAAGGRSAFPVPSAGKRSC